MNCPSCDLQALPGQKFCRSCGASLQMTTQRLTEPATVSELNRPAATAVKGDPQRVNGYVPWGYLVIIIGVAICLIGKKIIHEEILTIVGVLLSFGGMLLTASRLPARRQSYEPATTAPPQVLTPSPAAEYLPRDDRLGSLPSITERTTDLLKNPAPTRTRKKEDESSP